MPSTASSASTARTLGDLVLERAADSPRLRAYTFLADGVTEHSALSFQELELGSDAVRAEIEDRARYGQRALLAYPSGLEFVHAFVGCVRAGVVPVPVHPPASGRAAQALPRFAAIVADAKPVVALTTSDLLPALRERCASVPELARLHWVATDVDARTAGAPRSKRDVTSDSLALLQYASGSTDRPRGVMLTHRHLLENLALMREAFRSESATSVVTWLPLYHDVGLIGAMLQPLFTGGGCVVMPPPAFLQRPLRWLAAISRYRATVSGGPNFAYQACVDQVSEDEVEALDLRSWAHAFSGAEPARPETLERFARRFAPAGFRSSAFHPCFRLAESTLMVTGGKRGREPTYLATDALALARHRVETASEPEAATRVLVGCGAPLGHTRVVIVNPLTRLPCREDQVGEIWVHSPCVGAGYFDRVEESERVFRARLAEDQADETYLRTGDLGFLRDGELFVTGRLAEVIVARGKNHYPHDIEASVERSHGAVRVGGVAAYSIDSGGQERLVLDIELERSMLQDAGALREIEENVRLSVTREHDLRVHAVRFLPSGHLPRTWSGKIRRRACRASFLSPSTESHVNSRPSDPFQSSL